MTRDKLITLFTKFPGIGTRQAERFVYFLLRAHPAFIEDLISHLRALQGAMTLCRSCYGYFEKGSHSDKTVCETCLQSTASNSQLMVVAKDVDMETIKRSGNYHGKYFILGGLLPLMDQKKDEIRNPSLIELIKKRAEKEGLEEVIIALSASPEGDHTAEEICAQLVPVQKKYGLTITKLGRGLSTGTELEYSDAETIKHAMENRH